MSSLVSFGTGTNSGGSAVSSVLAHWITKRRLTVLSHVTLWTPADLVPIAPAIVGALLITLWIWRLRSVYRRSMTKIVIIRVHTSMRTLLLEPQPQRSPRQGFTCAPCLNLQANAEDCDPRVLVRARKPYTELLGNLRHEAHKGYRDCGWFQDRVIGRGESVKVVSVFLGPSRPGEVHIADFRWDRRQVLVDIGIL